MKKYIFSFRDLAIFQNIRLFALLLMIVPVQTLYAYDCSVGGIYYSLNLYIQTAEVASSPNGYSGVIHIPDEIEYNGVTYSVKSIRYGAFSGCSGLTSITIPNSVTDIGESAFESCRGLEEVTIGNSMTHIGTFVFKDCRSLKELTIPNNVTSISNYAFQNCSSLRRLTLSDGNDVLQFGTSSSYTPFSGCHIEEIYLGRDVIYPSFYSPYSYYSPFRDNEYLKSLVIGNSVTFIETYAFQDCIGLTELTIGNSVTSIGACAFDGCSGLTGQLVIPNSVTSIGGSAFSRCSGLTGQLVISNSVTSIGNRTFYGCSGLTELTIPNSVTSIGGEAFSYCRGLTSITSLNTTPPYIGGYGYSAFNSTTELYVPLHVPAGCKEAYQQANYWKNFRNIQDDASTDIKSINADKQVKNMIYTLDGMKLSATNVSDLPTGIYIINGKKVVVK